MSDSDERTNDEHQIRDAPSDLSSPAEKKAKVDQLEQHLRSIKAHAATRNNTTQAHVDDILAREFDAYGELEAKVQSAEQAVKEAQEYLRICRIELGARATVGIQAIRGAAVWRDEMRAKEDKEIQAAQERLDKARQEMTLDASPLESAARKIAQNATPRSRGQQPAVSSPASSSIDRQQPYVVRFGRDHQPPHLTLYPITN